MELSDKNRTPFILIHVDIFFIYTHSWRPTNDTILHTHYTRSVHTQLDKEGIETSKSSTIIAEEGLNGCDVFVDFSLGFPCFIKLLIV